MACIEVVITNHDSNIVANNDRYITTTKDWAKALLNRMEFLKGMLPPQLVCHHKHLLNSRGSFYLMHSVLLLWKEYRTAWL